MLINKHITIILFTVRKGSSGIEPSVRNNKGHSFSIGSDQHTPDAMYKTNKRYTNNTGYQ